MEKSKYTEPCNHCGLCCSRELCPVAEIAFPGESAPCPAVILEGGKSRCRLVELERSLEKDMIRKALGIGCGCSMPDADTSEEEIAAFDRSSTIRLYGVALGRQWQTK